MESITDTEDMLSNVLILAFIANVPLKSRVRENCKRGSEGDVVVMIV